MEGSDSGQPEVLSLQEARPCQETGRDKITELVAGGTAPEQTLPMAALSVSIPATEKATGREGRGLLTPARGISLAPLLQRALVS